MRLNPYSGGVGIHGELAMFQCSLPWLSRECPLLQDSPSRSTLIMRVMALQIDRLEITYYNIAQGGTQTFTHGGPGGVPAEIDIGRKIL